MNIGDKVREVHGGYEGIVVKLKDKIVEIEIEDGFVIPLAKSNLVVVSRIEGEHFRNEKPVIEEQKPKKVTGTKGLYLAFVKETSQTYNIHLINNTDRNILVALYRKHENQTENVFGGMISKRSDTTIKRFDGGNLQAWLKWSFQILPIVDSKEALLPAVFESNAHIKQKKFMQLEEIPVLDKKGVFQQLDQFYGESFKTIEEPKNEKDIETTEIVNVVVSDEIDLHIEALRPDDHDKLNASELFGIQMKSFDKYLDQAILSNKNSVVIIHGKGNGILQREVQRKATNHPHVSSIDEINGGSTKVNFK